MSLEVLHTNKAFFVGRCISSLLVHYTSVHCVKFTPFQLDIRTYKQVHYKKVFSNLLKSLNHHRECASPSLFLVLLLSDVWESRAGFHSGELTLLVFALNYPSTHPHFWKIKLNTAKSDGQTCPKLWITNVFPYVLALPYISTTWGFADIPLRLTGVSKWSMSRLSGLDSRYTGWANLSSCLALSFLIQVGDTRHIFTAPRWAWCMEGCMPDTNREIQP